mgnify:CR=1 FL=1
MELIGAYFCHEYSYAAAAIMNPSVVPHVDQTGLMRKGDQKFILSLRTVGEGEPAYRRLTGLEAWFAPAVVPATMHPPRHRMALTTWLGIFPTVSLVMWLLGPLWTRLGLPFLLAVALNTALIVVLMTWVVMPRVTRWLRPFLTKPPA